MLMTLDIPTVHMLNMPSDADILALLHSTPSWFGARALLSEVYIGSASYRDVELP